jgi:pyruvate-ferredoxin/flavodoxin oxidoreductase
MNEGRYAQLKALNPAEAEALLEANLNDAKRRYRMYQRMLAMDYSDEDRK